MWAWVWVGVGVWGVHCTTVVSLVTAVCASGATPLSVSSISASVGNPTEEQSETSSSHTEHHAVGCDTN